MGGGGGVRKVPKKCHVLFEWPLSEICVLSIGAFTASKRPPAEEKTIEEFIGRLQEREETTHATD